mmetsp:Transcript_41924/g.98368  ORF Transcript_41924/g.98368 Transcript_41924/m.98368 type:complete len:208 (-) Transcript_41924:3188-3811(-)
MRDAHITADSRREEEFCNFLKLRVPVCKDQSGPRPVDAQERGFQIIKSNCFKVLFSDEIWHTITHRLRRFQEIFVWEAHIVHGQPTWLGDEVLKVLPEQPGRRFTGIFWEVVVNPALHLWLLERYQERERRVRFRWCWDICFHSNVIQQSAARSSRGAQTLLVRGFSFAELRAHSGCLDGRLTGLAELWRRWAHALMLLRARGGALP